MISTRFMSRGLVLRAACAPRRRSDRTVRGHTELRRQMRGASRGAGKGEYMLVIKSSARQGRQPELLVVRNMRKPEHLADRKHRAAQEGNIGHVRRTRETSLLSRSCMQLRREMCRSTRVLVKLKKSMICKRGLLTEGGARTMTPFHCASSSSE